MVGYQRGNDRGSWRKENQERELEARAELKAYEWGQAGDNEKRRPNEGKVMGRRREPKTLDCVK